MTNYIKKCGNILVWVWNLYGGRVTEEYSSSVSYLLKEVKRTIINRKSKTLSERKK